MSTPGSGHDDETSLPPTHQEYGRGTPPPPSGYPQPSAEQQPYGQAPYGQAPYGQAPYGQAPYGQAPYGQQPPWQPQPPAGYGYGYGAPVPANHPSATTALALGIVGLAGLLFCGGLTLVVSPFAWRIGSRAVREIDSTGTFGGREQANAGRIMGIIGTVLLVLGVLLLGLLIVLLAVGSSSGSSYDQTTYGG